MEKKKRLKLVQHCEGRRQHDADAPLLRNEGRRAAPLAESGCHDAEPLAPAGAARPEEAAARLRAAQQQKDEAATRMPSLSPEQIHTVVSGGSLSQFELRRQADRYLLALCLSVLVLAASILRHTASAGITPFNAAVVLLSVAGLFVSLRAARSLWLMRQSQRHRSQPYRMACYADRLQRLSRRRRRWLNFVLRGNTAASDSRRRYEMLVPRIPSYVVAALLFIIIAINASEAFATTHDFVKITTTSDKADEVLCLTVSQIIKQL